MRITAPSLCAVVLVAALAPQTGAAEPETPYTQISKLAMYLSAGDAVGALEAFDKSMKDHAAIAENIQALAAQTDVLCSIDVVEDKEADNDAADVHHLDLDWYMMLKSRTDTALVERRRERVAVTVQRVQVKSGKDHKEVWRIISLSPKAVLAPLTIR
jgi:hypothetical protein